MVDSRKDIIENLLKKKKKTKRELAAYMEINEGSINRMLKNNNIALGKLKKIADFLDIDVMELFPKETNNSVENSATAYLASHSSFTVNEDTVGKLSEALLSGSRVNESLAETNKNQSQTINNLVKIIADKL